MPTRRHLLTLLAVLASVSCDGAGPSVPDPEVPEPTKNLSDVRLVSFDGPTCGQGCVAGTQHPIHVVVATPDGKRASGARVLLRADIPEDIAFGNATLVTDEHGQASTTLTFLRPTFRSRITLTLPDRSEESFAGDARFMTLPSILWTPRVWSSLPKVVLSTDSIGLAGKACETVVSHRIVADGQVLSDQRSTLRSLNQGIAEVITAGALPTPDHAYVVGRGDGLTYVVAERFPFAPDTAVVTVAPFAEQSRRAVYAGGNTRGDTMTVSIEAVGHCYQTRPMDTAFTYRILTPEVLAPGARANQIVMQGLGEGRVVVEHSGKLDTLKVSVIDFALLPNDTTVSVGASFRYRPTIIGGGGSQRHWEQFYPAGLRYMSSNTAVATIDGGGILKAVAPGTATLTMESYNQRYGNFTGIRRHATIRIVP